MTVKRDMFENVLKSAFNLDSFVHFTKELLIDEQLVAPTRRNLVYSNLTAFIESYNHIANYIGKDNKSVAVFAVELKSGEYVERARSIQRNFVKKLMENGNCDGALVAFYTSDNKKWRFSFIRMDYNFTKGKVDLQLTPAKRYSYLVGEDEPCHTALSRLFPIFINESLNPSLDEIEDAFSVEKVTKEFFEQYKEKYHEVREWLEKSDVFMSEAQRCNFTSEQFAKKMMGQIAFLYFIQKKGWLGVNAIPKSLSEKEYNNALFAKGNISKKIVPEVYKRIQDGTYKLYVPGLQTLKEDEERILAGSLKGQPWGTGRKDFMRALFNTCEKGKENYFDGYLEPLFYRGLNTNRGENGYFSKLHCRIPFLNGGLFEQLDNYEWEHNDFSIPNEMFSNIKSKDKEADGILDLFDRYNFTMSEDEPMEKEVAIDPEMLGKIFENLLEVKDRKSKGAFYTPREIVHYMCQESLTNYLVNETQLPFDDINDFILYGELMRDEDTVKQKKEGLEEMFISPRIFDIKAGVNKLEEIDCALANVRVADPAVGSGAFLLGMLNEIVRARQNISAYKGIFMNSREKLLMYAFDRHPYRLKTHAIKNSIFAVDIEPSAVDIAKLRLWLSLVIEDDINPNAQSELEGHTKPRPLPNLDCNIICGNSLVDEFQEIKLINQSELFGEIDENTLICLGQSQYEGLLKSLFVVQDQLFFESDHIKKAELKANIRTIIDTIVEFQLEGSPKAVEDYRKLKNSVSLPFCLWQLEFGRVFKEKGGFDIIIGNPPYIQLQKMHEFAGIVEKMNYKTFARTGDIYCLFYEKGHMLLHKQGILAFITSNKWMRAAYGAKLRNFFVNKSEVICLVDFAGQKIFESATVDVNILIFKKNIGSGKARICVAKDSNAKNLSAFIKQNSMVSSFKIDDSWIILKPIEQEIKKKIEQFGTPLRDWDIKINRGVLTGYNEAFIIDESTREKLIAEDKNSANIIRPILRGRDIRRYGYCFSNLYIINTHNGIKGENIPPVVINDYPAIKRHLDKFYNKLENRQDKGVTPYNLRNCIYMEDFIKPKIIWKRIGSMLKFSYDESNCTGLDSTCIATGNGVKFLSAILNTTMGNYLLKESPKTGTGDLIVSVQAINPVRIPILTEAEQQPFNILLDKIICCQKTSIDYSQDEKQLENLTFALFNIDCQERKFIENMTAMLFR